MPKLLKDPLPGLRMLRIGLDRYTLKSKPGNFLRFVWFNASELDKIYEKGE